MSLVRRTAALAGLSATAVVAMALPAQAATGTWEITVAYCNVKQQVQLQGSPQHDYMRYYTNGGSKDCRAWIFNPTTKGSIAEVEITTNGAYYSKWYYNGPEYEMQVCVNGPSGQLGCGPIN
ncbi:hypothetical protein [Streptomyces sp. NPDC048442]|uniref:hypothetical protein n=1 Tax=Streptomyces sp. NPDC048442 TaxID=3154823 RepID=UPI003435F467